MTDAELIASLGGPTKLAKQLNYAERNGVQRIQNWITRGIPAAVKVKHPDLFLGIRPRPRRAKPNATEAANA